MDLWASLSKLNPSAKISLNLLRISLCLAISVDKMHLKVKNEREKISNFARLRQSYAVSFSQKKLCMHNLALSQLNVACHFFHCDKIEHPSSTNEKVILNINLINAKCFETQMDWKLCGTAFDRAISECRRKDPSAPNKSRKIASYIKCHLILTSYLITPSRNVLKMSRLTFLRMSHWGCGKKKKRRKCS